MGNWTDRAASPAGHFPRGGASVRNVELTTLGPDGMPLVVTVRKADAFDLMSQPEGLEGAEAIRFIAEKTVIDPPLFTPGDGPQWDDLSLVDQMRIVTAVSEINTTDPGVAAMADAFPADGGVAGDGAAAGSGDRPGGDSPDAPGVEASSPAGEARPIT